MHLSVAHWLIVFANMALLIGILVVMVRRKFRDSFPFFFNFVLFTVTTLALEVALFSHISAKTYFYLFWTVSALATLLAAAVMREVFVTLLKPYSALVDFGKLLFRWAVLFLALVSVFTAMESGGSGMGTTCDVIAWLATFCELMQCGLLLLILLFQHRLGVSWRSPAICIMAGFGGNAALLLFESFMASYLPVIQSLTLLTPIANFAVFALWLLSFAVPQPERRTVQDSPSRLIFQRWNEALMATPLVGTRGQVVAMAPIESFLPGVERTVERVMARKMTH